MKFSIRDLFLVTVIVAVLLAWGLDHWRMSTRMQEIYDAAVRLEERLREKGFTIPNPIR